MTYKEKLKDPRWQKKKCEIMIRDKFTCQECGSQEKTLCVHHKTYDNCTDGDPWTCPDEDLVTWCEDCHNKFHHDEKKDYIERMLDSDTFFGLYNALVKISNEENKEWGDEWKKMLYELMGIEFEIYYTKGSEYDSYKKKYVDTYNPCNIVRIDLPKINRIAKKRLNSGLSESF